MKIYTETPTSEWEKIADFKADGSPLTVADKKVRVTAQTFPLSAWVSYFLFSLPCQANEVICSSLSAKYPNIPMYAPHLLPRGCQKCFSLLA